MCYAKNDNDKVVEYYIGKVAMCYDDCAMKVDMRSRAYLWGFGPAKDIPEAQCLITRPGDNVLPVGRDGQVEDTEGVSGQFGQLTQRGVLPDEDLVLRVPVGAHQLVAVRRPGQVADL